jgi:ribosomal protein S21
MGRCNGTFVFKKNPNESVDSLIKRFKQKVKDNQITQLYLKSTKFEKPSETKKKKKRLAISRTRKEQINKD